MLIEIGEHLPQFRDFAHMLSHLLTATVAPVIAGGTGTGKSHPAIAIARALFRNGTRGRFFNVVNPE